MTDTAELERLAASITPGPWRVEQDTTLVWGGCDPNDNSDFGMGYPIAKSRIAPTSTWAKGPDCDQGEANAQAIALVPDLLAEVIALREAVDYLATEREQYLNDATAAEADADRLAEALTHMVTQFQHPDQLSDQALAAHTQRVNAKGKS